MAPVNPQTAATSNRNVRGEEKTLRLSPCDPKNPIFYIPRAGFPEPDDEFYPNRKGSIKQLPDMRKTTLLRGLNITIGKYYSLLKYVVVQIHNRDWMELDQKTWEFKLMTRVWAHSSLMTRPEISKTKSDGEPIPSASKAEMVKRLFTEAKEFLGLYPTMILDHGTDITQGVDDKAKWRLDAKDEWERFDGVYQLQHIEIALVYRHEDSSPSVRTIIPTTEFMHEGTMFKTNKEVPGTALPFKRLSDKIRELPGIDTKKLKIFWCRKPNALPQRISNDSRLRNAVKAGRKRNDYIIELMLITCCICESAIQASRPP